MSQEAFSELVFNEMAAVEKIVGCPCKIEFTIDGRLSYTGYKITAKISKNLPKRSSAFVMDPTICSFYLTQFPGNCGMLITHETYQPIDFQKKGLSVPIQKMKEKLARYTSYTLLLATTIPNNKNDKVMERSGFTRLDALCFTNKRTTSPVTTWVKRLA